MKKSLLSFFVDIICVDFPFKIVTDVYPKKFECVSDGDGFANNEHRCFGGWLTSQIDNKTSKIKELK